MAPKRRAEKATAQVERALSPYDDGESPIDQRRAMLRKAEVGYYMALFPGVEAQQVCAKFGIADTTLQRWQKDDIFLKGFEKGAAIRASEQDEAARGFFKSRMMDYVERLDTLAMQDKDQRTALQALIRILESQGTLEQQKASIVNVAINLQRSLEGAAVVPQVIIEGKEVIPNGESKGQGEGWTGAPSRGTEGEPG